MENLFNSVPEDSRVWIFGASTDFTEAQIARARELLDSFMSEWNAHGAQVIGEYAILESRFIVVSASSAGAQTSGCSIDSMARTVRNGLAEVGVQFADLSDIFFRDPNLDNSAAVRTMNRSDFSKLVASGEITDSTMVFDPSVQSLSEFKQRWERPFAESWHAQLFPRSTNAS